jgi:hypothetical protein
MAQCCCLCHWSKSSRARFVCLKPTHTQCNSKQFPGTSQLCRRVSNTEHMRFVAQSCTCTALCPVAIPVLPLLLQSADDLELHWAADMALRLLQARHASSHQQNSSSKGTSRSSDASSPAFWGPWVDSLPQHIVTPVAFTTEEVEQLVIPSTVQVSYTPCLLLTQAPRPTLRCQI